MNDRRLEAIRDLTALLSALTFVLGTGLGLFLGVFYTFGPTVLGPFDQPVQNRWEAIPILLAFMVLFTAGGLAGSVSWILVMSRFLPKHTMYKWVTYGPQFGPLLSFQLELLNRAYRKST